VRIDEEGSDKEGYLESLLSDRFIIPVEEHELSSSDTASDDEHYDLFPSQEYFEPVIEEIYNPTAKEEHEFSVMHENGLVSHESYMVLKRRLKDTENELKKARHTLRRYSQLDLFNYYRPSRLNRIS